MFYKNYLEALASKNDKNIETIATAMVSLGDINYGSGVYAKLTPAEKETIAAAAIAAMVVCSIEPTARYYLLNDDPVVRQSIINECLLAGTAIKEVQAAVAEMHNATPPPQPQSQQQQPAFAMPQMPLYTPPPAYNPPKRGCALSDIVPSTMDEIIDAAIVVGVIATTIYVGTMAYSAIRNTFGNSEVTFK